MRRIVTNENREADMDKWIEVFQAGGVILLFLILGSMCGGPFYG